jgi:predicted LPLAT superfamily acyltransferase
MSQPTAGSRLEEWATRRERGSILLIRLMVRLTLRFGRTASRVLLVPVCGYYLLCAPRARRASQAWLRRALGRPPGLIDVWRHFWCFAVCVLDRVLLLNDRLDQFDIHRHGETELLSVREQHGGAFLFGAHLGSFEVLRACGRALGDTRLTLVMYQDNARKTNQVLDAINPGLAIEIVGLGRPGSMLAVQERLAAGHLVGVLADRSLASERQLSIPFLGLPARFPVGPFRLAALLKRPVVFMTGVYRGGRRYDIHFEVLDNSITAGGTEAAIEASMRQYVARLEHYCRSAPYNWFNFYDFWG